MDRRAGGYTDSMGIIDRILSAIMTLVTAPFRALGALFGRRGGGGGGTGSRRV